MHKFLHPHTRSDEETRTGSDTRIRVILHAVRDGCAVVVDDPLDRHTAKRISVCVDDRREQSILDLEPVCLVRQNPRRDTLRNRQRRRAVRILERDQGVRLKRTLTRCRRRRVSTRVSVNAMIGDRWL
jgi:hypothetical protein